MSSPMYSRTLPELVGLPVVAGTYGNVRVAPSGKAALFRRYDRGQLIGTSSGRLGRTPGEDFTYIGVRTSPGEERWIEYRNVIYPAGFSQQVNINELLGRAFAPTIDNKELEWREFLALQNRLFFELAGIGKQIQDLQSKGRVIPSQAYNQYISLVTRYNERQTWLIQNSTNQVAVNTREMNGWNIPLIQVSAVAKGAGGSAGSAAGRIGALPAIVDAVCAYRRTGLGAVPVVAIVIGVAIAIIAASVTIAILTTRRAAAKVDFDQLPTLKAVLDNLDPAVAEEVKKEVQQAVDAGFQAGARSGSFGNVASIAKVGVVGVGIYAAVQLFKSLQA